MKFNDIFFSRSLVFCVNPFIVSFFFREEETNGCGWKVCVCARAWCAAVCVFKAIHSVAWHHEGKQFVCSHSDGTLTTWNVRAPAKPAQIITPHGTSCCIHTVLYIHTRIDEKPRIFLESRIRSVRSWRGDVCKKSPMMMPECSVWVSLLQVDLKRICFVLWPHQESSLRMEKSQSHASLSWRWSTKQQGLGKCDAGKVPAHPERACVCVCENPYPVLKVALPVILSQHLLWNSSSLLKEFRWKA